MPCNCDHLEPTGKERRLSKVACLLDELDGKERNSAHWRGMHPKVYSQTYDKYASGAHPSIEYELYAKLTTLDVTTYSLEMQIWWRDWNKKLKKEKINKEVMEAKADRKRTHDAAKKAILAKLSSEDRKILST